MFKVVNQRSVSGMYASDLLLMTVHNPCLHDRARCAGVSIKTLELYASVFVFRLCSILFYDGYLPFDRCEVSCLRVFL